MAWILQHLHYTQCLINHGQLVNHSVVIRFDPELKQNVCFKQFRWFALTHLFGLHIKSLINLKIDSALSELEGGICPHFPPACAPGKKKATVPIYKVLVRSGRDSNPRPTSTKADALAGRKVYIDHRLVVRSTAGAKQIFKGPNFCNYACWCQTEWI